MWLPRLSHRTILQTSPTNFLVLMEACPWNSITMWWGSHATMERLCVCVLATVSAKIPVGIPANSQHWAPDIWILRKIQPPNFDLLQLTLSGAGTGCFHWVLPHSRFVSEMHVSVLSHQVSYWLILQQW